MTLRPGSLTLPPPHQPQVPSSHPFSQEPRVQMQAGPYTRSQPELREVTRVHSCTPGETEGSG